MVAIWTVLSIEQILIKSLKWRSGVIGKGIRENVMHVWKKKQPIGTKTTNNTNIFLKIPWIFPKNILIFNPFQTCIGEIFPLVVYNFFNYLLSKCNIISSKGFTLSKNYWLKFFDLEHYFCCWCDEVTEALSTFASSSK